MAQIVAGFGVPHTPVFPFFVKRDGPDCETAKLFAAQKEQLAAARPDVIVMFDTDHLNTFFLDNLPIFAVGVDKAFTGPNDEPREMPIYALTVAKNGPKLKETTLTPDSFPEGPPPLIFVLAPHSAHLPAKYATMTDFAWVLQRAALDHPVLDRTGLTGRYDFELDWTPDETQFTGALGAAPADAEKPGLFDAVQQQLGLKLEATRGTVQVLVIDRVERPSEN